MIYSRCFCHRSVSQVISIIAEYTTSSSPSEVFALRSIKRKSPKPKVQGFVDFRILRVGGGKGGDGAVSFQRLWSNPNAGPDGGDGGNGGHVIFQACSKVKDLSSVPSVVKGKDGEEGSSSNCYGHNADHITIQVPVGTIIRRTPDDVIVREAELTSKECWLFGGKVVGDLDEEGATFVAARGGAGGHGNSFFKTDTLQSPQVAEYGAKGEEGSFVLELCCISHFGLIGFPNAGKSTLLRSITRARPKVAPYPFTTLRPQIGIVQYSDYEQISVADLPGILPDAHKNRGLGLSFLRHADRCIALILIVDASYGCPWQQAEQLLFELEHFDPSLPSRALILLANKMDLPGAKENLERAQKFLKLPVIPISAKMGNNMSVVLSEMRRIYDQKLGEEKTC